MAFTTLQGTGGAPDSFLGTAGVDVIALQNQADASFLSARQDNDTVTFTSSTQLVSNYTLNGGLGNDTLIANNQTTLSRSFVAQNEGDDIVSLAAVTNSTVQGNQGADSITTAGLITSSLINGNQGNDTVNVNGGASAGSVFGGVGFDQITVSSNLDASRVQANEDDDRITITAANLSINNSIINGNQGNDTIVVQRLGSFTNSTIYGGLGNDTLGAANSGVALFVEGNEGTDALTTGAGTDTVNGGDGNDTINAAAGGDRVTGGAGNDQFIVAGNGEQIAGDSISGGTGVNAISFSGAADVAATFDFDNISDVLLINNAGDSLATNRDVTFANITETTAQTVVLDTSNSTGTINVTNAAASATTIFNITGGTNTDSLSGSAGNDTISGNGSDDTILGGSGADQLTGGAGNNRYDFNTGDVAAGETVDFTGGGVDAFNVITTTVFDNLNAGTNQLAGLDVLAIAEAQNAEFLSAQVTGLVANVLGTAGGVSERLIVDASSNAGVQINLAGLNLANATSSITGGTGADNITGTNATDTINSGTGGGTINGGASADNITTGAGNDRFVFANFTTADAITGFVTADDALVLNVAIGAVGTTALKTANLGAKQTAASTEKAGAFTTGGKARLITNAAANAISKFAALGTTGALAGALTANMLKTFTKTAAAKAFLNGTAQNFNIKNVQSALYFARTSSKDALYIYGLKDAAVGTEKVGTGIAFTKKIGTIGAAFTNADIFLI